MIDCQRHGSVLLIGNNYIFVVNKYKNFTFCLNHI